MKTKNILGLIFGFFVAILTLGKYKNNISEEQNHYFYRHAVPRSIAIQPFQAHGHGKHYIPHGVLWGFGILIMMVLVWMMQMDSYLKGSILQASEQKKIVDIAATYVTAQSPYNWGAPIPCDTVEGCDCSSFTGTVVKKAISYELPRISRDQATIGQNIDITEVQVGDLLFFNTGGSAGETNYISHVGIAIERLPNGNIVMANATSYPEPGKVQNDLIKVAEQSGYWYKAFVKAQRINTTTKTTVSAPVTKEKEPLNEIIKDIPATEPTSAAETVSFKDMKEGDSYYTAVSTLASKGIINSGKDVAFRPTGTLSRAEAVKIISEALGYKASGNIDKSFKDVAESDHWVGKYLGTFRTKNIMNGYENGNFGVNDSLTSEQLIKILSNAFQLPKRSGTFKDIPEDHWVNDYVGPFVAYDLFPVENGKIGFEQPVSRAKTIETVYRVLKYKKSL